MRERGMGGSGGIGMINLDVLDGGDGDLVGFCDECIGGVVGDNDNDRVGCDNGAGDGTDVCGADGAVVGLVEVSNDGYVEVYNRGESGGLDGGDDDGCRDGLMDGVGELF